MKRCDLGQFMLWFVGVSLGIGWVGEAATNNWPWVHPTNYIPEVTNAQMACWASNVKIEVESQSVQVVTNVVETSDESGCATCDQLRQNPGILIYHESWGCKPYHPATWKLTTTTVKEVWTLTYRWRDKEWTQTDVKVLDTTFKKVAKTDKWVEAPLTAADTNLNKQVVYWNGQPMFWFTPNSFTGSISTTNLFVTIDTNTTIQVCTNGLLKYIKDE